jgi:hypothetical protein
MSETNERAHLDGHAAPEVVGDLSISSLPLRKELVVVLGVGEDDDTVVVLGSGTKKGHSSNVDLLDGLGDGRSGDAGDGLVEGVEVANDNGDGSNLLGLEVGLVRGDVAGEDT